MKRILASIAIILALTIPCWAQYPGPQGQEMYSSGCATSPRFGTAYVCFDTTLNQWFTWSASASAFQNNVSKSMLNGGNTVAAALSTSAANYFPINGFGLASTTETDVSLVMPSIAYLSNLHCTISGSPGGTNKQYAFTLRDNAASPTSGLTCTTAGTATTCADNTHTVTIAVGDLVDVLSTPSNTPTARSAVCSVQVNM